MRFVRNKLLIIALLILGISFSQLIDTVSLWVGSQLVGSFGEAGFATVGQIFTVDPIYTILDSWTYYLDDLGSGPADPSPGKFAFYVMDWEVDKAVGSVLFESSQIITTNNGGADGFEIFEFLTGGLHLEAGNDCVAFLSVCE